MGNHTVHIAATDKEAVAGLAQHLEALAGGVVRLADHAHPVALSFQNAADDGRAEAGVIHIGVTHNQNKVQFVPAALAHILPADGQKLCALLHRKSPFYSSRAKTTRFYW